MDLTVVADLDRLVEMQLDLLSWGFSGSIRPHPPLKGCSRTGVLTAALIHSSPGKKTHRASLVMFQDRTFRGKHAMMNL